MKRGGKAALALGAIGVVFGDIGTSPLYTLRTVFAPEHGLDPSRDAVFGVVSLIFWSITLIVSVKFVTCIMRADNDGEGGIMALIALIQRAHLRSRGAQIALVLLGVFGASLFYGDGMITPAISVLSAVEGLEVVSADLKDLVLPITLIVLTILFGVQRYGTAAVGGYFGPVMCVWFGVLALSGLARALEHPEIFGALSPHHGAEFLFDHGHEAFVALGGVVLAVTGAEALYADIGHFGASAIRRAWFGLVFGA
jgi:KUP system potassium uptake protein